MIFSRQFLIYMVLAALLLIPTSVLAGTEPSPFQPALTIENTTDLLDVESPFYLVPFKDVTIEIFYMGADRIMIKWGNYFIESVQSGEMVVIDPDVFNAAIPSEDIPTGSTLYAKGTGSAGEYSMMLCPEGFVEIPEMPRPEPFVELTGCDAAGGGADMLPIYAFGDTSNATLVGAAEIAIECTSLIAPKVVQFPNPETETLQDAIDLVADGGTVKIKAGVYEVPQPLFIAGKTIKIKGAGSRRENNPEEVTQLFASPPTDVVAADSAVGVINFVGGAGGVIKKLDITGGDACVVARDTDVINNSVMIKNVVLGNTGRGILWQSSAQLAVKNALIENCLWNAISVAPPNGSLNPSGFQANLTIKDSIIINPLMVGLYFSNAIGFVNNVSIYNSQAIAAYQSKVQVTNSCLYNNKISAITFQGSNLFNPPDAPPNLIQENLIINVDPDNNGNFGDGINLFASDAEIDDNQILSPFRSGIANYGSFAIAMDNYIFCAAFDVSKETFHSVDANFDDQGGNLCGCTNDPFHGCTVGGIILESPPPVGDLE